MKITALVLFLAIVTPPLTAGPVKLGNQILVSDSLHLLKGRRVGLICNQTSRLPDGTWLVDTLQRCGINVTALFAPEHGIRGEAGAGITVGNDTDRATHLPVFSLYGGTRKPAAASLDLVDVLVFDIQDVGARFYTYASTMAYAMEAAAQGGKDFIVCDRPNPINGESIEGPCLDLRLISFLGLFPIPVRHGLTLGELAMMIVGEGYINPSNVNLRVIPMTGWKRSMWYDETGLPWIAPSPAMKTLATATVYPGLCFIEATNLSEGRGTRKPFEYVGAPKLDPARLIPRMSKFRLPGVRFRPVVFTPAGDTGKGTKFAGRECHGIEVQVTDRKVFQPVLTGILLLEALHELYPRSFQLKEGRLDRLVGDDAISARIVKNAATREILKQFDTGLGQYRQMRSKYLIY